MHAVTEPKQRKIRLKFPQAIQQIDERTIELVCPDSFVEVFNEYYIEYLNDQLGKKEACTIIEDAAQMLLLKEITSQIRLGY